MAENVNSNWASVGAAVDAGHVYLQPGVAGNCARRCGEFIVELKGIRDRARGLGKMDGFGDRLQSGVTLATKFEKKAIGGDYSMDQAIADHIAVVQEMQHTFEKIEAMYSASEDRGTAGINSAGAPL